MANTFYGLTIGRTGLYTYQAAINTAAHNASNVDTEGYSRQETVRQAAMPLSLSSQYGMTGSGVTVTEIRSIRDAYYDSKYRYNNAILANQNTKAYYLDTLQSYFSEVNADGTTAALDEVFATMKGLANDVGNTTIRTELATQAKTFTESLNYLHDSLQRTQMEINYEIKTIANQINAYAQELAAITRQINTYEVRGDNANDLRDQRELIVDKLSEFANVSVSEVATDHSVTQYIVKLDGAVLVDTYEYYTLEVEAPQVSVNEDDIEGLYKLVWSNGQSFASQSASLGGKLQSLFELRDGNNNKNFNGAIDMDSASDTCMKAGSSTITVKDANIQNIAELNIPQEDGLITIGNREYVYKSFKVDYDDTTGEYVYTFELEKSLGQGDINSAKEYAKLNNGNNFKIGKEVDYKGVPYYMAQINEFARTFAKSFNEIHKQGKDFYGNCEGNDFFTGTYAGTGKELDLELTTKVTNPDGTETEVLDKKNEYKYYYLNAGNFKVSDVLMDDVKKIACGEYKANMDAGVQDSGILNQLMKLQTDVSMFKQGTPASYLESLTAVLGVAGQEAESFVARQEAILATAEQQRYSISGVDQDEEAMDLTRFRNAYNLCSKVISVMNEIYDKLINGTGV